LSVQVGFTGPTISSEVRFPNPTAGKAWPGQLPVKNRDLAMPGRF